MLTNMETLCKKYVTFFKQGNVSNSNPNSVTQNPFFVSEALEGAIFEPDYIASIEDEYQETFSQLDISLRVLYTFIGDNKEFSIKGYNFFTLKEIHERSKIYKHFYDIGLTYFGMGHIIVLSYSPKLKKFFLREDGGANGYEREAHFKFYSNFDLENCEVRNIFQYEIHKPITFLEFMNTVK